MRISTTAVDEVHPTRRSSLILCNLVFNSLKVMSVLKEKLNNNAADGMIIWKHVESFTHLQLVSSNAFWLKKIAKMVRWTANNSLWLMWHEQIKEINMKMKTGKDSTLLPGPRLMSWKQKRSQQQGWESCDIWRSMQSDQGCPGWQGWEQPSLQAGKQELFHQNKLEKPLNLRHLGNPFIWFFCFLINMQCYYISA